VKDVQSPKKLSAWWAIGAVLVLVGVAMWFEGQYRAVHRAVRDQPIRRAAHKPPQATPPASPQPQPSSPDRPDESGLLIG